MTSPRVVVLEGTGLDDALVGGKAASLDRLIGIGMPVPLTGAVTTAGYRAFVAESGLGRFLEDLRSAPLPDPDQYQAFADRADEAFLEAPMPSSLRDEIRRLADQVGDSGRLAVRSSATAEDTASASFAGQYRSFLEIDSEDQALEAVRQVWASLWLPGPRSYRRFRRIDETDLAMAVVIMRLVEAELAGVIFTVDPGGENGAVRLESVEGLAEQLVSGEVTPQAYVVPRMGPRVELEDAHPVYEQVVDLALLVENKFDHPQDIEWAYDGNELYLVQARPITTAPAEVGSDDGFDTDPMQACTYTTAGIAEMVPGQLPPLLWTINGTLLEEAFRRLFDGLGALPDQLVDAQGMIARFRGRAALNLDLLKVAAAQLPGGSSEELERQYFGRVISDPATNVVEGRSSGFAGGIRSMLQGAREIRARSRFAREAEIAIAAVDHVVATRVDPGAMSDEELISYRHRLLNLGGRTIAAEVAVAAAAAAAYRGIELFLENRVPGDEIGLWAQRLTTGGIDACGGRLVLGVCDVVASALSDTTLSVILLAEATPAEIRRRLSQTEEGREFVNHFDGLLRLAGSAAVFGGPMWGESETLAWQVMRQAIEVGKEGTPATATSADRAAALGELEETLTRNWRWRTTRVFTGQIVDVRKRMLRRMVADAVQFLDRRERAKSAVLRLGGEVRRVHLEAGRRLVDRGALDAAEDLAFLASSELDEALAGSWPPNEMISRRRRQFSQAEAEGELPTIFVERPSLVQRSQATGDSFQGWAGSPGLHRGRAMVVRDPTQPLARDDVLVARTTDPSWTPLFLTAGAIVVEEGGPLSHAAIVARELGLPAVLNVPGIVDRLGGGDYIVTVDGTAGTVTITDKEKEEAEAA
ncbi:MAG: PEP/pyruvate-binding domain-containing protein [Acidimicrobiia bacterium]